MSKRLIVSLLVLLAAIFSLYWIIPQKIHVSQVQYLPVPSKTINRLFNNLSKRKEWWPTGSRFNSDTINYNGYSFAIAKPGEVDLQKIILSTNTGDTVNSYLSSNVLNLDSSFFFWECTLHASISPINRIQQYLKARKIKKSIDSILDAFAKYVNNQKNIYGISIAWVKVPDSILISEKKNFSYNPGAQEIYEMINALKKYTEDQNAKQTNFPMINIMRNDSNIFSMMAAIPINKTIKEDGNKKIKRLFYGGHLLMAEIKGGPSLINNALKSLDNYKEDYKLISPAIPYQSLITDRTIVTDTSQWITRVYYPVY